MKFYIIIFLTLLTFVINAQLSNNVLLTVADKNITADEFLFVYNKNNINEQNKSKAESIKNYLQYFIDFKLKIAEAESKKLDKSQAFKKEYNSYKNQLIETYLKDKKVSEDLISEAYLRSKQEISVSHLLINCKPKASARDSLQAYLKAMHIKDSIDAGKSFKEMALKYSEDPSVVDNFGNIGYISTFGTVYPFENATYNTKVGEVSDVLRTRFGFHILNVIDKRNYKGKIEVAQIYLRSPKDAPAAINAAKEKQINEIYNALKSKKITFEEAVLKYSQDRNSNTKQGKMSAFKQGEKSLELENAAFNLKNNGELSKPFKTERGWHILKKIGLQQIGTINEERAHLTKKITKDSRCELPKTAFVNRVKASNNFKENIIAKKELLAVLDSKNLNNSWKLSDYKNFNKNLFFIADKNYTQSDFLKFLKTRPKGFVSNYKAKDIIVKEYEAFVTDVCDNVEKAQLDDKFPEFTYLSNEYREGILLFNLTQKEIWSKSNSDSLGLQKFYAANKQNYKWDERADAVIYKSTSEKAINKFYALLKKGKKESKILSKIKTISITKGTFEVGRNKYVDVVNWKAGIYGPQAWKDEFVIVKINKILDPEIKKLNEAKGFIVADYQTKLIKIWVEKLKKKFKVEMNESVLNAITK